MIGKISLDMVKLLSISISFTNVDVHIQRSSGKIIIKWLLTIRVSQMLFLFVTVQLIIF